MIKIDILKAKTAKSNHVVFSLVSILWTSTWCRIYNKVPCTHWKIVSMNTLSWNGRTCLMNYTRELSEIWLSGCARILRFTRVPHMVQTFFRSSELLQVVCYIHYLVALTRVTWSVIPCQHHTEIGTDIKKKNRSNNFISIPHRSYVSLNGYAWSFRVHGHALVRSVMLISRHI